ncbi:MAG: hypothetical protein H6542_03230 [Lentimicrobiaceae bacterium]|nr:hypothetical protein [Lentimicrobiaceae bacterium]
MKITKIKSGLLLSWILAFTFYSCKHEPESLPNSSNNQPGDSLLTEVSCHPDTVYFENDILPILLSGCAMSGCHDAATAQEGVLLTSYNSIITTGEIRPGNPGNSKLYEVITDNEPDDRMPPVPNAPLSTDQILKIRKWIEQGARNNRCDAACDTNIFTFSEAIQPLINTNCKGCHQASQASGGIRLDDYTSIHQAAANGSLLGAISHQQGYSPMPKGGNKLSDCAITQVKKWIESGAGNN